jgi:hypothetical protein
MKFSTKVKLGAVKNSLQTHLPKMVNAPVNNVDNDGKFNTCELTFNEGLVRKETILQEIARKQQPIVDGHEDVLYPVWVSENKKWFIGTLVHKGKPEHGAFRYEGRNWELEKYVR